MTAGPEALCPLCGATVALVLNEDRSYCDGPEWPRHGPEDTTNAGSHGCLFGRTLAEVRPVLPGARDEWPTAGMRAALAFARAQYQRPGCSTGGRWHVVLDDDNYETSFIAGDRDEALAAGDLFGAHLGNLLLALTVEQWEWIEANLHSPRYPELGAEPYGDPWSIDQVTDPAASSLRPLWDAMAAQYAADLDALGIVDDRWPR